MKREVVKIGGGQNETFEGGNRSIIQEVYSRFRLCYFILSVSDYQGLDSHQEAAIILMKYVNNEWYKGVRGTKSIRKPMPFVEFIFQKWLQQKMKGKPSGMTFRERRSLKRTVDNYWRTEKPIKMRLVHTDWTSFDHVAGYPIYLNKGRMIPSPIDFEEMLQPESLYEEVFFETSYGLYVTKEEYLELNNYLFPNKKNLVAYSWNDSWSSYFTSGRGCRGAHMWTIYDSLEKRMVVIGASTTD